MPRQTGKVRPGLSTRAVRLRRCDLGADRMAHLTIQYASTLRNLGRVEDGIALLEDAEPHATIGASREIFLALALRDAGRGDEALRIVMEALASTLPRYRASVLTYAAQLAM